MAFLSKIKQYLQEDLRWSDELHWLTISHRIRCLDGLKFLYSPTCETKCVAYIFIFIIRLIYMYIYAISNR